MSAPTAYVPCRCPKCVHRPVNGVCRCRVCAGEDPRPPRRPIRPEQKKWALNTAAHLLAKEDLEGLTELEELRLNTVLELLTRSE